MDIFRHPGPGGSLRDGRARNKCNKRKYGIDEVNYTTTVTCLGAHVQISPPYALIFLSKQLKH